MKFTNKKACQLLGWDRKSQGDELATGHCHFAPSAGTGMRFWEVDDLVAGQFYMDQRAAGLTVKLAGQAASRLRLGIADYPDADQLTIVALENGSMSVLPTDQIDLSTGYMSGGYIATALMIPINNIRMRVQRSIDADAEIVGGDDA